MDGFKLKVLEHLLYSKKPLTIQQLNDTARSLFTISKGPPGYLRYTLLGRSGRSKRLNTMLLNKLLGSRANSKVIYTFKALMSRDNYLERPSSAFSKYAQT